MGVPINWKLCKEEGVMMYKIIWANGARPTMIDDLDWALDLLESRLEKGDKALLIYGEGAANTIKYVFCREHYREAIGMVKSLDISTVSDTELVNLFFK